MSERKVLNKYYPPDYDPSKIPRTRTKDGKGRNATFEIRLMAPCNMRCTTCGEYIYKGRKFNARKEDVDDMSYLGLRIYRFYIKCTACVSEICFRTDPENTDYVLEAGATRNFEALKKAEEQADREAQARKEELENNPMKLLEERTAASKNEMEIAESLDELRELNRRTVNIDYQGIIEGFADERRKTEEERLKAELAEDEAFVKSVFSKSASGEKIKRVRDDSSSDEETPSKFTKPENPTDFLVDKKPENIEKKVWERSIGSLGVKKGGLGVLVKKKSSTPDALKTAPAPVSAPAPALAPAPAPAPAVGSSSGVTKASLGGLGMLGNYSGSSDSTSD